MKNPLHHFKGKNFIAIFCFAVFSLAFSQKGWGQILAWDFYSTNGSDVTYKIVIEPKLNLTGTIPPYYKNLALKQANI